MKITEVVLIFFGGIFCLVDYEKYPVHTSTSITPDYEHYKIIISKGSYNMTGNLFVLQNPLKFYSIYPPAPYITGCPERAKTSSSAAYYKCFAATNAGFFVVGRKTSDYCIGNIVSNGNIVQIDGESRRTLSYGENHEKLVYKQYESNSKTLPNFGMTFEGNFIIGYLEEEQVKNLNFSQLVSGVIWLVRDGKDYVDQAAKIEGVSSGFINEAAPRNTVGHDKDGNLMLLQLDGNERKREGPGLHEVASVLIDHGSINAINLDGGGSTTAVLDGKILSNCTDECSPTEKKDHCPNNVDYCERSVTTLNCINYW